ncbi:protein OSCP1 [Orussus abietinus]|uniref:protein OSCP1 n=1 Tax=Orussus abietinus TaxID=222816 RepID=UPI00062580A8|nr:protein OSCP1 [Orussus abietinus]
MSHATPLLYLNLGGEMLYVLQQRLKAQHIERYKTVRVLDDVIAALLNPKVITSVLETTEIPSIPCLRSTLECVALSSIMRLDSQSMGKLFDLMITIVKYQFTVVTGPRELILITLNHLDSLRELVCEKNAEACIGVVHGLITDLYGNMTHEKIWQIRNECLRVLEPHKIRVSVLLRLGLQNNDTTFNVTPQRYNEKYLEQREKIKDLKIKDVPKKLCVGSLDPFGDRVTVLGRNIYSSSYGSSEKPIENAMRTQDYGVQAELGMLAMQLGTEEPKLQRPFSLNLFSQEERDNKNSKTENKEITKCPQEETESLKDEKMKLNEEYKSKLNNAYGEFLEEERVNLNRSMDLLELLDEVE